MTMRWSDWSVLGLVALLLLFLGVVGLSGGRDHGPSWNRSIIQCLDTACQMYKKEHGSYPPGRPDFDSRVLHEYLGKPRVARKPDGTEVTLPPLIEFSLDWLSPEAKSASPNPPVPIVDVWGRPIKYANPGRYNAGKVDIWSMGKNGREDYDPRNPQADIDGITNWIREY